MKGVVDVKATEILDTFRPGMRNKAWMSKHPILQVANNEVTQAKARANTFLEKYVTGKEDLVYLEPSFLILSLRKSIQSTAWRPSKGSS